MNKKMSALIFVVFSLGSCIILWMICRHMIRVMPMGRMSFMGGPTENAYSPLSVIWWLLLFTPVWFCSGFIADLELTNGKSCLYRYGRMGSWWLKMVGLVSGCNLWYFLLDALIINYCLGAHVDQQIVTALFLQMIHALAMTAAMLWICILTGKLTVSAIIIIVAEAVAKLFVMCGIPPAYMPLVWGMYGYSSELYSLGHGFNITIAIAGQLLFVLTIVVLPLCNKRLILRSMEG